MSEENVQTSVPTFLKVLCILTFVGSGLGILGNLSILSTDIGLVSLLANVSCIIGAVMMLKLKKTGFYIYAVAELLPLIYTFVVLGGFGAMSVPFLGEAVILVYLVALIIPLGFIAMYAINLKHMN